MDNNTIIVASLFVPQIRINFDRKDLKVFIILLFFFYIFIKISFAKFINLSRSIVVDCKL